MQQVPRVALTFFIDLQMTNNIVAGGPELQGGDALSGGQEGKEEIYFEF
jgi:hypothetical protein